jgi:hypothetical protein
MYNEGTTKAMWAVFAAILIAVAAAYWDKTLFLLRFVWDLIVINIRPLFQSIHEHWPFS